MNFMSFGILGNADFRKPKILIAEKSTLVHRAPMIIIIIIQVRTQKGGIDTPVG